MGKSGQIHALATLILPESSVPIKQDAGSAHSRSGCFGEDTDFLLLPGCPASKFRFTKSDWYRYQHSSHRSWRQVICSSESSEEAHGTKCRQNPQN